MKFIIIPKSDQKPRKHEEYRYPNMELPEKALHNVGKIGIKYIAVMGYKNKIGGHGTHPCQRRNVI